MKLNPEKLLNKSYQSDKKNIKLIADNICHAIYGTNSCAEFQNKEVYLAIDEAVSNAMEHGNKWNKQKFVEINIIKNGAEIIIIVKDEGIGFDTSKIKYELDTNNILKQRGRGIFIMNKYCELKWNNTGNELQLKIRKEFLPGKKK